MRQRRSRISYLSIFTRLGINNRLFQLPTYQLLDPHSAFLDCQCSTVYGTPLDITFPSSISVFESSLLSRSFGGSKFEVSAMTGTFLDEPAAASEVDSPVSCYFQKRTGARTSRQLSRNPSLKSKAIISTLCRYTVIFHTCDTFPLSRNEASNHKGPLSDRLNT